MHPTVLRALEFDRVREALALETLTPLGRARALALEPATDPALVARRLDLTSEAVRFVAADGSLAVSAPEDLATIIDALEIAGQPLEPLQLLGLARFADSVEAVVAGILRSANRPDVRVPSGAPQPGPPYALLSAIAGRAASFAGEAGAVRHAIEPSGDVSDHASPALRDIRDKLRRQRAKLRATLESFTRGRDTAKYLQDQIVTDRNGRYVLVLRAEHRDSVPGVVHGSSASGASLYLEPLPTVELNNEIVALAERETEEVWRILLALTDAFRLRDEDLAATLEAAGEIDELHGKAALAARVDGIAPAIATDGRVEFRGARHPLLIPAVRDLLDRGERDVAGRPPKAPVHPIASDLLVIPLARALVISGPNTGGKTVALKAIGLLALMAQAGLLIPAERGSRFTPFATVFADIGDEQSISASLSTFSAHIANIVAMDRALELPALVLLDEVGGGTDPLEGGALGTAVIEHFRERGAVVIATTHDDALKSYAATTGGVTTAAFGFNPETYAPTYRLLYGVPGRSLALEIAQRLGMPASVIHAARARRSARESQLAAHLARIDAELATLERDRREVARERDAVTDAGAKLKGQYAQLKEREAALKRRMDDKLNDRLRDARADIDAVVADLKAKAAALAGQADRRAAGGGRPMLSTGEIGGVRAQARAALDKLGKDLDVPADLPAPADQALTEPPYLGQSVFVPSFGVEAIVRGVSGRDIDIEIRGKRMRMKMKDLRPIGSNRSDGSGRSGGVTIDAATRVAGELMLVGCTVDEAIARAEKFLDDAILGDQHRLRVVHGHGTGRLREALTAYFREHPLVASVSPAPANEGGSGATIVELKD
jgi:DNA mismatch repair protein MutS2